MTLSLSDRDATVDTRDPRYCDTCGGTGGATRYLVGDRPTIFVCEPCAGTGRKNIWTSAVRNP